jgi:hypothetical protein
METENRSVLAWMSGREDYGKDVLGTLVEMFLVLLVMMHAVVKHRLYWQMFKIYTSYCI